MMSDTSECQDTTTDEGTSNAAQAVTRPRDRRYGGLPIVFMAGQPGEPPTPAPFLMSRDEVIRFLRLHDSRTRFPDKAVWRYRHMGLNTVRVGRCVWYRLDDVLRFLDGQQARAASRMHESEKTYEAGEFD